MSAPPPPSRPALKKALGQHHLVDGRLCAPLIAFLRPAGERVLEVGPGGGVLTDELLAAGARVWAWELDPAWAFTLRRNAALESTGGAALGLVVGDAMTIPWQRLPAPTLAAGNLPYAISTALIARMLRHPRRVPRAAFLVQKEVGDRLVAGPGDPDYGALSVLVAARSEARLLGRVKAGSFRPPPKVDGAFVGLVAREPPLPPDGMERFEQTVHRAFGQRRKTLRNSLGRGLDGSGGRGGDKRGGRERAAAALEAAGISERARAEELALGDFLRLHAALEGSQC
jgi:16S rRNA (adenine1518-N6/adenine1519-N6)-dimethyltransferase